MLLTFGLVVLLSLWHRDLILASAGPSQADIVDIGYAQYQGNRSFPNTVAYLGIPYAEPPLGPLRFRAPLPLNTTRVRVESGGKVVDAQAYPEFCVQGTGSGSEVGGAGTEDCLKVNIYTPSDVNRRSRLPVLVYIHGGGYIEGNPRNWPFEHWVHQSPNVVIVSVYYRLSSLGFLAIPEFRDSTHGDLNAGFLDQIQALRWVKQNIARFGGDPSRVTINGESAGGASVELHLVARTREDLFSGAIAQSVYRTPLATPEQRIPLFQYYAAKAGCEEGGVVARQLECLRKASVSALARAQDTARPPSFTASGYNLFQPVVDGKVLVDFPTRLISEGKFKRVPLIIGATTNETLSGGDDVGAALRRFFPSIADKDIAELHAAYPAESFASESLRFQVITGDSELKCANTILGTAYAKAGQKTWVYRYNQRNPTNPSPSVTHAAENWMMFLGSNTGINGTGSFSPMSTIETAFASELIAYWLSFVRRGNPNTFRLSGSPAWSEYRPVSQRNRIVLQQSVASESGKPQGSGSYIELEEAEERERCIIVAGQVERQQN